MNWYSHSSLLLLMDYVNGRYKDDTSHLFSLQKLVFFREHYVYKSVSAQKNTPCIEF